MAIEISLFKKITSYFIFQGAKVNLVVFEYLHSITKYKFMDDSYVTSIYFRPYILHLTVTK